ncbi:hypothetical protein [Acetobacterium sp.]|uniref:hypothetical protein n=1 Tax=Acetobacterium sp. TaxID=1872094 RepID=UPI00271AC891|nr:hypothetical protein [Acetobacterium sp.]MDO9491257.1 hypothetical protein [Acetobacterium sp.]
MKVKSFFSIFSDAIIEINAYILTYFVGIDTKMLRNILKKEHFNEVENNILQSFDIIQEKLTESQIIIENTLKEVSEQKRVFEKMSSDAEICKNVLELNEKQFESIRVLIERPIKNEGKKATINTIIFGAFFCIVGVVLGYLLAQF